jgi:3-deoxy-D-manno-octulosonic-acid transferase
LLFFPLRIPKNVLSQSQLVKPQPILEEFSRNHSKIIVCGSIWPKDLEILAEEIRIRKDVGWIIAPHEIDNKSVSELLKNFEQPVDLYSDLLKSGEKSQSNIIILNTIGDLFHAYRYADIAYVGGAFVSGLHNILEPAAFGKAVLFGPEISKFPEASFFIHQRIGAKVTTQEELSKYIELFYQEKADITKNERHRKLKKLRSVNRKE